MKTRALGKSGLEVSEIGSATPTTGMMHIALQEQLDGSAVNWMEKVSDEQYRNQHEGIATTGASADNGGGGAKA